MSENNTIMSFRVLILVTTPKLSELATEYFKRKDLPIHYKLNAVGTAPSDILDILGIGTSEKSVILCMVRKDIADVILRELYVELMFGVPGNGIAFTLPLGAANKKLMNMMNGMSDDNFKSDGKEELIMSEIKRVMIAAVINPGFSEEVMKAAKGAGARGGTVIHGRGVTDDEAVNLWGLGLQEEKEIVMIVTETENKLAIMNAISESCGVNTDAQGFVVSLPIDTVIGIRNN
ncbi:MAG: hypothetical protein IKU43_08045 [Clostridia bacterium]|nr:hypothetical protein [Clostridia bacterium]